jgi:hypothetical protein
LCIAHQYWTIPEKVAVDERVRFEKEAKTQAWEEELDHLIKVKKKKVRRTGGATREEETSCKSFWKSGESVRKINNTINITVRNTKIQSNWAKRDG